MWHHPDGRVDRLDGADYRGAVPVEAALPTLAGLACTCLLVFAAGALALRSAPEPALMLAAPHEPSLSSRRG